MRKSKLWTLAMTLAAAMGGAVSYDFNDGEDTGHEMSVAESPSSVGKGFGQRGKNGENEAEMNRQTDWRANSRVEFPT